jgi:hypothetical protein
LTFTALSALALDQTFVEQTMQSARNIERDAVLVSAAVKSKKIDPEDVKKKIDAMSADIATLQKHVADFEATNPQINERDRADWQLVKDKVQLVAIFHGQKQKLASEDLVRHRNLIRAHANGVALRAEKLQETLTRLARVPLT